MISRRRLQGKVFERKLHAIGLHRLRVEWWPWKAKRNSAAGEFVSSPQRPLPFGPHLYRAVADDGTVVVRPWDERYRVFWLGALQGIPEWDGMIESDAAGHRNWLKVPPARVTDGSYAILECVDGFNHPIYRLAALDGGPVELNDYVARIVKSSFDRVDEIVSERENSITEHEVTATDSRMGTITKIVKRDPMQRAWREATEDKVADLESYAYKRRFGQYQFEPSHPDDEGERHPAGFIIRDRRVNPQSGLAGEP